MRVLILTSSGGTAHDAAAYALRSWLKDWDPCGSVWVEHLLENSSPVLRKGVHLYNWIQKNFPKLHQIYWRFVEFEDLWKPGTVLFGRPYLIRLLKRLQPNLIISTHPHINRGHFDLAKRVLGPSLRCITCCTELDGGFGFSRNWVSPKADQFWAITPEVAQEVKSRKYQEDRIAVLGPLFDPTFEKVIEEPLYKNQNSSSLPILVLGTGANGSNNHVELLNTLLPLSGRIHVIALCGKRATAKAELDKWIHSHPQLSAEALGFQSPSEMARLYRKAWAMVTRPGARTATEALAAGCILIFNGFGSTMPQELLARRYFFKMGIDVAIDNPEHLLKIIVDWLNHPKKQLLLKQIYNENPLINDRDGIRKMILELN